jgi:hypothetical protein
MEAGPVRGDLQAPKGAKRQAVWVSDLPLAPSRAERTRIPAWAGTCGNRGHAHPSRARPLVRRCRHVPVLRTRSMVSLRRYICNMGTWRMIQ